MRTVIVKLKAARIVLIAALAAAALFPRAAGAELAVGVARDFTHDTRANALVLRYDWRTYNLGSEALVWYGHRDGSNGAITLDYNILGFFDIPVDFDLGAAYIARTTRINGSNLNFQLTGAVNLGPVRVFLTHFSNAGISPPNPGWNFAGLAYRF